MTTTETPGNKCLECGYQYEAASGLFQDDITPQQGDVSICLNCGVALIFNADLTLRRPTPEEKFAITMSNEVMEAQIARAHCVTKDLRKRHYEKSKTDKSKR
jgi:hypothetical protein